MEPASETVPESESALPLSEASESFCVAALFDASLLSAVLLLPHAAKLPIRSVVAVKSPIVFTILFFIFFPLFLYNTWSLLPLLFNTRVILLVECKIQNGLVVNVM